MTRRISTLTILSLLVVALMAMSVNAAKAPQSTRVINQDVNRMLQYALPLAGAETGNPGVSSQSQGNQALGMVNPPSSNSPGMRVGNTYYDYQHNGRMTRMVDWGYDATSGFAIHFNWMWLESDVQVDRKYAYNAWLDDLPGGAALGWNPDTPVEVQGDGGYAGYVAMDVTDTDYGSDALGRPNAAVLSGHAHSGDGIYRSHTWWDFQPTAGQFIANNAVEDSVWQYALKPPAGEAMIWPSIRYHDIPGFDPVLHVFANETQVAGTDAGHPSPIAYFRKVGYRADGDWDYPPKVVDTGFTISQGVAVSKTGGKVALTWAANLPAPGDCDECSDNTGIHAELNPQIENDIYYMISPNFGEDGSWLPRVNLTKNVRGVDGYRAYTDMQGLIDSDDNLHIVWSDRVYEGDGTFYTWRCRMRHWGEALGFETGTDGKERGRIRTAANLEWDQTHCDGGSWNQLNGAKMNIGECDGRLYYTWTQFNNVPAGDSMDCAQRALDEIEFVGAANGELWLSVSNTLDGLLWDKPRNLTNSPSPGCGPDGDPCDSDHWSSMAREGYGYAGNGSAGYGDDVPDSVKVDPSGSYTGTAYIPIQYINDKDAGGVIQEEGSWQQASVTWFSLACVDPVETKLLAVSPTEVGYPAYTDPAVSTTADTTLTLENTGNADLTASYSVTMETDGSITPGSGSQLITAGFNNTVPFVVTFTKGAGNRVAGELEFSGAFDNAPISIPLEWYFVDTIIAPTWDTVEVTQPGGTLSLTVANSGNKGNQGAQYVNLDYWQFGDCDIYDPETEEDPYPGDASIYLYDGSKVICWDEGGGPVCDASIFDRNVLEGGFVPGAFTSVDVLPAWLPTPLGSPVGDIFTTTYYNRDTTIQIDEMTFAPDNPTHANWMIQVAKFSNLTGSDITGLAIGDAIDWDIPSDSASWNNSGFDASRRLIYQVGSEFGQDDQCQPNDDRYGGVAVAAQSDGTEGSWDEATYGMYTLDNPTQVYPFEGFNNDSLYKYMQQNSGFSTADAIDEDLHSMATFQWNYTLTSDGQLLVYTCLVSEKDGETAFLDACDECLQYVNDEFKFFEDPETCCLLRGDVNHDGVGPDIADLLHTVNYMFSGGPPPVCEDPAGSGYYAEADVNADGVAPDIADLLYIVNYMFSGGPAPIPCP